MKVKELIEMLEKLDGDLEVRIVSQYDEETGNTYHNQIDDVYTSNESGKKDVVVLESDDV